MPWIFFSDLAFQACISFVVFQTKLGVLHRPLTLVLLQKYRDTNGRRIMIQIGGVYTTLCQEEGMLLLKYRDRNGRCIAILLKCIGSGVDVILLTKVPHLCFCLVRIKMLLLICCRMRYGTDMFV